MNKTHYSIKLAILILAGLQLQTGALHAGPRPRPSVSPEDKKKQEEAQKKAAEEKKAKEDRINALISAIQTKQLDKVNTWLQTMGDVNAPNSKGETPLYHAAKISHVPITQALLAKGADLMNTYGHSAMRAAISNKNAEIVNLLITKKANIGSDFNFAVAAGNTRIVEIFIANGANVNAVRQAAEHSTDFTPLMAAIDAGNLETATLLVNKGAKVNQSISQGKATVTVLKVAAKNPNVAFVQLLLSKNVDVKNTYGGQVSCLVTSVDSGNIEIAKALLAAGADAKVVISIGRSNTKMTPLKAALQKNRQDFADLFKAAGATE